MPLNPRSRSAVRSKDNDVVTSKRAVDYGAKISIGSTLVGSSGPTITMERDNFGLGMYGRLILAGR